MHLQYNSGPPEIRWFWCSLNHAEILSQKTYQMKMVIVISQLKFNTSNTLVSNHMLAMSVVLWTKVETQKIKNIKTSSQSDRHYVQLRSGIPYHGYQKPQKTLYTIEPAIRKSKPNHRMIDAIHNWDVNSKP